MRLRIPLLPLINLALFAGLCAIVAYWAMVLLSPQSPIAPSSQPAASRLPADPSRTASLFGQPSQAGTPIAAPAAAPVNIRILGVMAVAPRPDQRPGSTTVGVALVSIDGQPARPYTVGEALPNGLRVQAILPDRVEFNDQGRILSSPTPAGADPSVLVRGSSGPVSTSGASPSAMPALRPPNAPTVGNPAPPPAPLPPGGASGSAEITAGNGQPGQEAPMPPPPPLAPGANLPGPVTMPSR